MRFPFRSYNRAVIVLVSIALFATATMNSLIDPFGAYAWFGETKLDEYKWWNDGRAVKAEIARHGAFDIVFVGASRVQLGFDPKHESLRSERVYNLGLGSGTNYEIARMIDAVLQHPPKMIVLCQLTSRCIDFDRVDGRDDFENSRLNPDLNLAEYHFANLLSGQATKASFKTLKNCARGRMVNDRGLYAMKSNYVTDHRERLEYVLGRDADALSDVVANPESLEHAARAAEKLLTKCRERGVRVVVLFPPVHACYLESFWQNGGGKVLEQRQRAWTTAVSRCNRREIDAPQAELWDFTGFHGFNAEPPVAAGSTEPMQWYWDPSHFRPELGNLVLDRILGRDVPVEFGVQLTEVNIDRHIAQRRIDRAEFARQHQDQIELVSRVLNRRN